MFRRHRGEVVEGLVHAGGQAGGGHIVAENSAIDYLGEEGGLRNQFPHQVRNIFLTFGREGFLIARAAAEGDDNQLFFSWEASLPRQHGAQKSAADERQSGGGSQEVAAITGKLPRQLRAERTSLLPLH